VKLGSNWGEAGVKLGSTRGQPGVNLGSTRGQPGVNLGSTRGQPGVNLRSTWGQPGVNLHRPTMSWSAVPGVTYALGRCANHGRLGSRPVACADAAAPVRRAFSACDNCWCSCWWPGALWCRCSWCCCRVLTGDLEGDLGGANPLPRGLHWSAFSAQRKRILWHTWVVLVATAQLEHISGRV
jgi:hypothetical protein